MTVIVVGADRDHGDRRSQGIDQRLAGCRCAAVVRDLEDIDVWQTAGDQLGIDVILGVAAKQEPPAVGRAQEHDRGVVDLPAGAARLDRDRARVRPQHVEVNLRKIDVLARSQVSSRR